MFYILAIVILILFLSAAIKVLREYERGVIFRLGRVIDTKGPGLIIIIPIVDEGEPEAGDHGCALPGCDHQG